MQNLTVTDSKIVDIRGIKDLTGLINLNLSNNSISDASSLGSITSLKLLNLSGNQINKLTDASKKIGLENLKNLDTLNLSNNNLNIDNFVNVGANELKPDFLDIFRKLYFNNLRNLNLTSTGLKNIKSTFQNFGEWKSLEIDS